MSADSRARALVASSALVAVALVGAYLAAGGASYAPEKTQDPCEPRQWRDPEGLQQLAEQFSLSAMDGAACELGVSREALAQALASPEARDRFSERFDISDPQLARAIRAGLLRAVDDAEDAGALNPLIAAPLRETIESVPLDQAIELLQNTRSLLDGAQGFLGPAQEFLEQLLP